MTNMIYYLERIEQRNNQPKNYDMHAVRGKELSQIRESYQKTYKFARRRMG